MKGKCDGIYFNALLFRYTSLLSNLFYVMPSLIAPSLYASPHLVDQQALEILHVLCVFCKSMLCDQAQERIIATVVNLEIVASKM